MNACLSCFLRRRAALALFAFGSAVGVVGSTTPAETPAKPYTLYLGADFSLEWKGALRPVVGVERSAFVVDVDGRHEVVPTFAKDVKIKLDATLKVTASNATLTNFKTERAYTLENDPQRHYDDAARYAADAAAAVDLAVGDVSGVSAIPMGRPAAVNDVQQGAAMATVARRTFDQAAPINSVGDAGMRAAEEAARELYDAFLLTFEISAPAPLEKPYLIAVTRYREQRDQPQTARLWVYAQELERVDALPRKFRMFRGGFPRGYQLEDVKIHIYDRGTEIATSLAAKRVALTADEAFQFAVVDYIEQHRGATLEPSLMKTTPPVDLRSRISPDRLAGPFYLKIAENGRPTGVFRDERCTDKVKDAEVGSALMTLRFNPALKNGRAVEGVAHIQSGQLGGGSGL